MQHQRESMSNELSEGQIVNVTLPGAFDLFEGEFLDLRVIIILMQSKAVFFPINYNRHTLI